MEANEEELLENVTDEAGNSYMIQRMAVDGTQLIGTELLQTSNGLVVDLGGDFITSVNYASEDLLPHEMTEEDRNLAATLVAVQFNQQQKQQQSQSDGNVIINATMPSFMSTGLDGTKVQLGEQQVLLQDKQTGFLQIVDAEDLYKQEFDNSQALQLIMREDEVPKSKQLPKVVKKSLPHKKRIAKKVKKSEHPGTTITKVQECKYCQHLVTMDNVENHEAECEANLTSKLAMNAFSCQICSARFADQLQFFEHLKKHYEPVTREIDPVEEEQYMEEEEKDLDISVTSSSNSNIIKSDPDEELITTSPNTLIKIKNEQKDSLLSSILQLTCLQCNKTFRRHKPYVAHIRDAHKERDMDEFSDAEDLMAGINVDTNSDVGEMVDDESKEWYEDGELQATEEDLKELEAKDHLCPSCNQQFLSRSVLIQHMAMCTTYEQDEEEETPPAKMPKKGETSKKRGKKNKIDMECTICGRKFAHRNSLVYHMRSHSEDRPYQCDQCGKSFFAASALKVHLRLHSGEKPYRCDCCGRHFRQWGDLKYHCISIHSEEKQYQCEYCGKEFARKYSLIVHRRIHTGEKNYRCEFCGKTFRASSYLQNHRRIHTGEKPHPCETCGKRFRVRSDMKRHMRTHVIREGKSVAASPAGIRMDTMKIEMVDESEDTNESLLLKEEDHDVTVQALQYDESLRDANTLYVHMPILITGTP